MKAELVTKWFFGILNDERPFSLNEDFIMLGWHCLILYVVFIPIRLFRIRPYCTIILNIMPYMIDWNDTGPEYKNDGITSML